MRRFLLTLVLFFSYALALSAAEPKISNLRAAADGNRVSVSFVLDDAFQRKELVEALQSGLPTGFTYHVQIYRSRPNWFDETVSNANIEVVCTYNSTTREYLLNYRRNKKLVRSEIHTDIETLKQRMTTIEEPDLFDVGAWVPYKLKVAARADLMRSFLFGVIPWDLSTGWKATRVRLEPKRK